MRTGRCLAAPDDRLPETALAEHMAEARELCAHPPTAPAPPQAAGELGVDALFHELRWFLMPDEAAQELEDASVGAPVTTRQMNRAGMDVPARGGDAPDAPAVSGSSGDAVDDRHIDLEVDGARHDRRGGVGGGTRRGLAAVVHGLGMGAPVSVMLMTPVISTPAAAAIVSALARAALTACSRAWASAAVWSSRRKVTLFTSVAPAAVAASITGPVCVMSRTVTVTRLLAW